MSSDSVTGCQVLGVSWLLNTWVCVWGGEGGGVLGEGASPSQASPSASVYLAGLELILYNRGGEPVFWQGPFGYV